jgi:hypothetical protein
MYLGSRGRIRRLVAASSHELAQKGIAAAIRVHVNGVDEIAFLKFVRHLICSDLLW